jgi:predicted N-acetyltransferase YhbS
VDDAGMVKGKIAFQELVGCAMIRELHVYGQVVQVNRTGQTGPSSSTSQQHAGFGTRLMQNAIYLAHTLGYKKISVISGEGVKPYYRRFGFYDGDHFMMKNIDPREFRNYHYVDRTSENITRRYHQLLLMATIIFVLIALYNCW